MAITYRVERAFSLTGAWTTVLSSTSSLACSLTNQPLATILYYRIAKYIDGVRSSVSDPRQVVTLTSSTATASGGAGASFILVSWNSTCAQFYRVYRYNSSTGVFNPYSPILTSTSFNDYAVSLDETYHYYVVGLTDDQLAESIASNVASASIVGGSIFMATPTSRATVYQGIQIGPETTAGVLVPTTKRLAGIEIMSDYVIPIKEVKYVGTKVATGTQKSKEAMSGKYQGIIDYNLQTYIFASMFGLIAPNSLGPYSQSWHWAPSPVNPLSPLSFTVEQGSAKGAEKWGFNIFGETKLKWAKDTASIDGTIFGQSVVRNAVMTSNVPRLPPVPADPRSVSVYYSVDSLNYTKITQSLDGEIDFSGLWDPTYHVDDANNSFDTAFEKTPSFGGMLTCEEGSDADMLFNAMENGSLLYLGVKIRGPLIETIASAPLLASPLVAPQCSYVNTGGTIVSQTYFVAYTYIATTGETRISPTQFIVVPVGTATNEILATAPALPAGATGTNWYVGLTSTTLKLAGTSATVTTAITALPAGGAAAAPSTNTTPATATLNIYHSIRINMPVYITKPAPGDKGGVYGNTYTFTCGDDDNFGMADITIINKLAQL